MYCRLIYPHFSILTALVRTLLDESRTHLESLKSKWKVGFTGFIQKIDISSILVIILSWDLSNSGTVQMGFHFQAWNWIPAYLINLSLLVIVILEQTYKNIFHLHGSKIFSLDGLMIQVGTLGSSCLYYSLVVPFLPEQRIAKILEC